MISNGLKCKLMSVSMTETDLSESVITSSRALHLKIQKCNIHKYRHVLSNYSWQHKFKKSCILNVRITGDSFYLGKAGI